MRHRLLVSSLLLVLGLTLLALPAQGQPPTTGAATVTFADNGDCTVTVTYTWSGFKGRDLTALYGVRWPGPGGTTFGLLAQAFPVTGSGSASHTFDLTDHGAHDYYGGGQLLNTKGKELTGSAAVSPTGASLDC